VLKIHKNKYFLPANAGGYGVANIFVEKIPVFADAFDKILLKCRYAINLCKNKIVSHEIKNNSLFLRYFRI
jgi:hypothetical protein